MIRSPRTQAPAGGRHPIQVVSQRTGIPPELLRVWEKRYRAVAPPRSGTGRRLYSDDDVERLRLLRRAIAGGRRIGEIAALSGERLRELVREDENEREIERRQEAGGFESGVGTEARHAAAGFLEDALRGMRELNPRSVGEVLERAAFVLGGPALIEAVIAPLMREIGERWHRGELEPAAEHMVTAVVRNALGEMIHGFAAGGAPGSHAGIVVGTLPGERHELGAMMAAAAASAEGLRVTYMGPDLPVDQLAAATVKAGARAIALSIVHVESEKALAADLVRLRALLPPEVAIFVGGQGATAIRQAAPGLDARFLSSTEDLRESLREIEARSGRRA